MSKSLEELKDLFENFESDKFIEKYPEIWDDCYDIEIGSRYHRLMTSCMLAGWFAAIKAVSEREKKITNKIIKGIWNDIYGRSGGDYFLDCGGEEWAKETQKDMKKSWSKIINEALKDYRGMK